MTVAEFKAWLESIDTESNIDLVLSELDKFTGNERSEAWEEVGFKILK